MILRVWSVYDWNDLQGNFGFFNYFTFKKTDYLSDDRIWNHAFYLQNRLQPDFSILWYTGHPLSRISFFAGYAICTPLFQCGNNSLSAQYPHFLRITVQISKTKLVSSADSCWIYACIYPANALPMVLSSYKLVLAFISAVLVTVVICNNWYPVHKRIVLPILWGCVVGIPTLSLLVPYKFPNLFPPYVSARISNWIYPFSVENANQSMVHEAMTRSTLFGHSTTLIMDLNS